MSDASPACHRLSGKHSAYALTVALCALLVHATGAFEARAECDTISPTLTALTLTPSSVDVTGHDAVVTCTMTVEDAGAGVEFASCSLENAMYGARCNAFRPSGGDRWNGTFSCAITIPRYGYPGTWRVRVNAQDALGNYAGYAWYDLSGPQYQTSITVTDTAPDTEAPVIDSVEVIPPSIDTTDTAATVTCRVAARDNRGMGRMICRFNARDGLDGAECYPFIGSGTCIAELRHGAVPGYWNVRVDAWDSNGNARTQDGSPLLVVNRSFVPDHNAPQLLGFDIRPRALDPKGAPARIRCSFSARDDLSGISGGACYLRSVTDPMQTTFCVVDTPPSSSLFSCDAVIPVGAAPGTWQVEEVDVSDQQNNGITLDAAALAKRGFPADVQVGCNADAESALYFRDAWTLAWHAVAPEDRQNVYRGSCSELVDANHDGFPDHGYGACQNARDPDLSDNVFVDPDVPLAARGYFYLVTHGSATAESGLGYTSGDAPRPLTNRCP